MCSPAILFTGWEDKSYMSGDGSHPSHETTMSVNRHRGMRIVDITSRMWVEHELIGPTY